MSGAADRGDVERFTRRRFLEVSGATAASLALFPGDALAQAAGGRFGALARDPGGMIDLPRGFQYRVLSAEGTNTLRNASRRRLPVPGDHDGMAAFAGPGNTTVLVRNHELRDGEKPPVVGTSPYDREEAGGTTAIVVGPRRTQLDAFVTSSGSLKNCAGGGTPWGTWITCEEDRTDTHGYCFEVVWTDPESALSKTPITDMGHFSHEAVDVDARTGVVYLTEDSGPESFLYRYLPHDRRRRPGALQNGGTLEALAVDSLPSTPRRGLAGVRWITVNPDDAHDEAREKGAARFGRLEGCHFQDRAFWFSDTSGGKEGLGQVFRLRVPDGSAGRYTLELFLESTSKNQLEAPDNVVVAPWGDLFLAEDGGGENRLIGVTPTGGTYVFARSQHADGSEFAGPTFSPDGQTLFVNVQDPGMTFAIWGRFPRRNRQRARRLANAEPPAQYGPVVSDELAQAAEEHGLTALEAAAYDRLGVPVV
jgi:uncharacterized protein